MLVSALFTDIRYQLSDELKISYSDTELIGYLNQVNEFMYETLLEAQSNLVVKEAILSLTNGVVALPSDFLLDDAVTDVDGNPLNSVAPSKTPISTEYKIMVDSIYSDNDSIKLYYYYMPDAYTAITDTLLIPAYFQNLYRQMIKFLVMNTDEYETGVEQALMSRFESIITSITGKRGNTNPVAVMPFMV